MNHYGSGDSITAVKGIGPAIAEKLARLDIRCVGDLLRHFPRTYLDFSKQVKIRDLKDKVPGSFLASISLPKTFFTRGGKLMTQAIAQDQTGKITLTWFNNPYIKRLIKEGSLYSIAGKPSFFGRGLTIVSPMIEEGDSFSLNTKGLVPVYPQTEGITSRFLRKKIHELLEETDLPDPLDSGLLGDIGLLPLHEAVYRIHFPAESGERWMADKRLSYNEHLRINLQNALERNKLGRSIRVHIDPRVDTETVSKLPFTLTKGQERAVRRIEKDLGSEEYTHRLIQGETGSGKTAPLIFAANQCLSSGQNAALMAPTEILATQHFATFQKYLLSPDKIKLITSNTKTEINPAEPILYIGTHALLTQLPKSLALAFVAIDEQHKFGVAQREILMKRSPLPHLFNLSATPIPRTVALGLLGDIEISNLTHKPDNRLPVKTFVVSPSKFKDGPNWLITQLENGNQIFVVCPNISEHMENVSSVEKQARFYRCLLPTRFPVLTIHGQMSREAQQTTLQQFKDTSSGVLVATSLIEVGIDIPSANIMIIHSAERFGLAQLHQLRGRVGRGKDQGYCFLVPSTDDEVETERLQLLQKFHTGLSLAQKDLRLRGAGEIFGIRQHGALQTRLKYFWSKKLFLSAKANARKLIRENPAKAAEIARNLSSW